MTTIRRIPATMNVVAAIVFCVLLATMQSRAVTITADAWTPTETIGPVTYAYPAAGSISVGFPRVTTWTPFSRSTVVASSTQSPAYFAGDFVGAGISTMKFALTGSGELPGENSYAVLKGQPPLGSDPGTGREWYHGLNVSTNAGEATDNMIAMDRAEWVTFDSGDMDALWAQDIVAVESVGVRFTPNTKAPCPAYTFTVSAFGVESSKDPGNVDALKQALLERFGVSNVADVSADLALVDTDGDGMTDLDEIRAAYEAGYFSQIFKVSVESAEQGITIRWACVKDRVYTLLRADSMNGEFVAVASGAAPDTGYQVYNDTEATLGTSYFYKVVQQ